MDVLESILERIAQTQEQRDVYLRQAEVEEQKIGKLEQMYYMLEDPATQELMRDVVISIAEQNGTPIPANGNVGAPGGDKHYVGMQRVRDFVAAVPPGETFTIHDLFQKSIEHVPPNPKMRHPEFERQRKASISIAVNSMVKGGDVEVVKQGRGRESSVYRRPEARA